MCHGHFSFLLQISIASELADELKLMDGSAATPSKLPPSTLEVEQDDSKLSQERKRKASNVSVATRVMSILHGKLTTFMCNEYNNTRYLAISRKHVFIFIADKLLQASR